MNVQNPSTQAVLERAWKRSVREPADEQAQYVLCAIGPRVASAAVGLKNSRTLNNWAAGGSIKSVDAEHRLQILFRIVLAIDEAFGTAVATAFLRGSNPALGGRAPLVVLADESPHQSEPQLLKATEALLDS